jgi:hypothetical protein
VQHASTARLVKSACVFSSMLLTTVHVAAAGRARKMKGSQS